MNLGLAVISADDDGLNILPRMIVFGGGAGDVDVSAVMVVVDAVVLVVVVSFSETGLSPFAFAPPPAIMFGVMTVPESTENRYLLAGESLGYCGAANMMVAFGSFCRRTKLSFLKAIGTISVSMLSSKTSLALLNDVVVVFATVVVAVVEVVVVVVEAVVEAGVVQCRLYMVRFSMPG